MEIREDSGVAQRCNRTAQQKNTGLFATPELPPLGGMFKQVPEDFEVEELPAYLPSGEGPHLYLQVEKRGCTTVEVARALAAACGVRERDVGYAGLKDRQAVTRQWFSLMTERDAPPQLVMEEGTQVKVLAVSRHGNKLRTGQLRGNRFVVRLRGATDASLASEALNLLFERGIPNWFGPQRFGRAGDNAELGRALLEGGDQPQLARVRRDRFLRKLALSAFQSALFNEWLGERLTTGAFRRAEAGDLLQLGVDGRGPVFLCQDPEVDDVRVQRFEVSPTGPLFGSRMRWPEGEPLRRERELFERQGLSDAAMDRGGDEFAGARRACRVRQENWAVEEVDDGLRLTFSLPRGAYATSLLRELLKVD
jgi:tRNA pseudouridine13 synthase